VNFSALQRGLVAAALAFWCVLLPAPARAQGADEAWQNYITQALYAAGAKDYPKSKALFDKALHEAQRFGPADPRIGATLNSLGLVYRSEKKLNEADAAFRRALPIMETANGSASLDTANINFNIAGVAMDMGKWADAAQYLKRCLQTYQEKLGEKSLKTGDVLCMVGEANLNLKAYVDAEATLKRCADIRESDGGMENAGLGDALHNLAVAYQKQGRNSKAEPTFKLAAKIREKTLGITSPAFADSLEARASVLKDMGRSADAEKDAALAAAIRRSEKKAR
jgi:tetratricopeptide (TPR) repeat protein